MSATNILILAGRLTKDPEIKKTNSGKSLVKFSIAVNEYKDKTTFVNCTAWEKLAESIGNHYKKGMLILVKGSLAIDKSEDKYYTSCNVQEAQIMDWGKNNPQTGGIVESATQTFGAKTVKDEVDEFDSADMPF